MIKKWKRIVIALIAVTILSTAYLLILPARTQTTGTYCREEEHIHSVEAGCYREVTVQDCTDEGTVHTHTADCYQTEQQLICGLEENEEHTHTEECYGEVQQLICGMDEGQLIEHVHTDACFHTEMELACTKEEHTHTAACYANPHADVETAADWEATLADVELTGDWSSDVLRIAQTQLGYTESTANYITEENQKKGYTRYGAWYGDEYGHWCAMFVSFCLHYAGVEDFPLNSNCQNWIDTLRSDEYQLYHPAEEGYIPEPGDLIFFDWNAYTEETRNTRKADHIGLVYEVNRDEEGCVQSIQTIEGNSSDRVQYVTYEADDSTILGYGELPENPDYNIELETVLSNGIAVKASIPGSSLSYTEEEVTITASVVQDESLEKMMTDRLDAEGVAYSDLLLLDINLHHGDEIIEPEGPLSLTIEAGNVIDTSSVYHLDEARGHITDMEARVDEDGTATIETDHFSVYALTSESGQPVNAEVSAQWNETTNTLEQVRVTASSEVEMFYGLDNYNGTAWSLPTSWTSVKAMSGELDITNTIRNADMDSRFRVRGTTDIKKPSDTSKAGYTKSFGLMEVLDSAKEGFSDWLAGDYLTFFDGSKPSTTGELYDAFALYYSLPTVTITATEEDEETILHVSTDYTGTAEYVWEYLDRDGVWQQLVDGDTDTVNASQCEPLRSGGAYVRCRLVENGEHISSSPKLFVNPRESEFDQAAREINAGLGLSTWTTYVRVENGAPTAYQVDLSIGSDRFDDYFYYDNVAADLGIEPTATAFKNYLALTYINAGGGDAGLSAVSTIWNRYLYDLYDPSFDAGKKKFKVETAVTDHIYPDNTYGDKYATWPKDEASSFNGSPDLIPTLEDLDYDYLEKGVDYRDCIDKDKGLEKTVTAAAAGDGNSKREYAVDLSAKVQAKAKAPVALILQIQTSWQMFDLYHSNIVKNDGSYYSIEEGSAVKNTDICTIYEIKKALIQFVEYIDENYPGNNLVLGVTEVQHDGSSSLFYQGIAGGKKGTTSAMYVTNDFDTIIQGLYSWNSFGNCEHVHYDSNTLVSAVSNLKTNLAGWTDAAKYGISYNDVRKAVVIIGGSTENTDGTNGYGITLPWGTFQTNNMNSVYGIRTNEGTPVSTNKDNCISWLEYSGNYGTGKTPFADGKGDTYTKLYTALDSQTVFEELVEIAETEMTKQGISLDGQDIYVEDVTIEDTITDEFYLDESKPILATIYNSDGSVFAERTLTRDDPDLTITKNEDDGTTTISYNFGDVQNTKTVNLHFDIVAQEKYIGSNNVFSNVGTPGLTYAHTDTSGKTTTYDVASDDTPEVNVPIRFSTEDGGGKTVLVNTEVNLGDPDLNVEQIVENVHDLVDNYDQITGTLSYVWELPDGTTYVVPTAVHITGGTPDGALPKAEELSTTWTPTAEGSYQAVLKVTFTPDPVVDNGNFANDGGVTATAVNPRTEPGSVWIQAVDGDTKLNYYVQKQWEEEQNDIQEVSFVMSDGRGQYLAGTEGAWTFVDDVSQAASFTLTSEENWKRKLSELPSVKEVGGETVILNYQPVENPVPEGYEASYSMSTQTDEDWTGYLEITLNPKNSNITAKNVKYLSISYTYGGKSYSETIELTLGADVRAGSSKIIETAIKLPLNGENQSLGDVVITNLFLYKAIKADGSYDQLYPYTNLTTSTARCVPTLLGEKEVPVFVITNKKIPVETTTVTIQKTISGEETTQRFPFTATLSEGAFIVSDTDTSYTVDDEGVAHFQIGNRESVTLTVPINTTVTITEEEHDGYYPIFKNGPVTIATGDAATVAVESEPLEIRVINTGGAVLPKTGGPGLILYTISAVLLLAGMLLSGFYIRRRRERRL